MQKLNLPEYVFKLKNEAGKQWIFDAIRKKYIVLTPEEWVRQHFIQYLIQEKKYPATLMAVEKKIMINGQPLRFDLVVYQRNGQPLLVAEFKAPQVKITQEAFNQVVRYNMELKVQHVVVSNGMQHYVCEINNKEKSYAYLREIPEFHSESRNSIDLLGL